MSVRIQEGSLEQVCVAVVIGTPEEAAAFVRRLAPNGVSLTVTQPEPSIVEMPVAPASGERKDCTLDDVDHAVIRLCETAALTPSECTVLALRGRGFTNREIAEVLDISGSTVKCHVNNALRKLGERSGARPARVIACAVADVRGRPVAMTRDHDAWLRPLRIALARLEPKVETRVGKAAGR